MSGWGRNTWGSGLWGEGVPVTVTFEGFGRGGWGDGAWGESLGLSATGQVGSVTVQEGVGGIQWYSGAIQLGLEVG